MRIIQLLNSPNWSGASNYCILASQELIKRGHDVLLLTEPGKPLEKAKQVGIPYDDTIRLNHRNPLLYVQAIKRMKRIFKEFKPDIISANINEGAWMPGMIARKVCPNAIVARIRTDIDAPKGHFINKYVYNNWTDCIIAGSELHRQKCNERLDFPLNKIFVVYGGVDTDLFNPANKLKSNFRIEIGAKEDDILVGMLARLSPVKGHEYAISALAKLKTVSEKIKLVCVAYESERTFEWLKNLAQEKGVADRLICVNKRTEIPEIVAGFDIGILCSLGSEANTRSGLEYMASGKPFVGTSVGVIPEVILNDETGYLVKPGDSQALADAIVKLALNPAMRQLMGQQARNRAESLFSIQKFGESLEEVYKRLIISNNNNK